LIRRKLFKENPRSFAWGDITSVSSILQYMLACDIPIVSSLGYCPHFHVQYDEPLIVSSGLISCGTEHADSLQSRLDSFESVSRRTCNVCNDNLVRWYKFINDAFLLAFEISPNRKIILDHVLRVVINENDCITYHLRGVIYHGNNHFTCRVVSPLELVWFHDGLVTGSTMVLDGNLSSQIDLYTCREKSATVAVYLRL